MVLLTPVVPHEESTHGLVDLEAIEGFWPHALTLATAVKSLDLGVV